MTTFVLLFCLVAFAATMGMIMWLTIKASSAAK